MGHVAGRIPEPLTPATAGGELPLRPGDHGEAVRDLQRRLAALGHDVGAAEHGTYADATLAAVRSFQVRRGLRVDGVCGPQTWNALVEAGFRLGERLLYLRQPMLRGDDVADLQRRLAALGFDTGRTDGIFGPLTVTALTEFQRNAGITVDGIGGPETLTALARLGRRDSDVDEPLLPVGEVRERDALRRAPRTLVGRQVGLGHDGGLGGLVAAVGRAIADEGAQAVPLQQAEGEAQAAAANLLDLDLYVGFALDETEGCATAYWRSPRHGDESAGGRRLAQLIQERAPTSLGVADGGTVGMALPVLRETRMPAVVCTLGPPHAVVQRTAALADAIARALRAWAISPC